MGSFVKGDVVVIPFPFTDLSASKRRPALIVAVLDNNDVVLCQITGQNRRDHYSVPLSKADFTDGNLVKPSFIRPNRLFTAEPTIILYRAGRVHKAKLKEVVQKIVEIVQTE